MHHFELYSEKNNIISGEALTKGIPILKHYKR